jgi:hypothetical protein
VRGERIRAVALVALLRHAPKHPSQPAALARAVYDAAALTVTLAPRKKLMLNPPLQLRIIAAGLSDLLGGPLDHVVGRAP